MPCVSCKFTAARRSETQVQKKNGAQEKRRQRSGCDLSHCTFRTAPVEYKVNEKNYYPEMHGAWRYHPHNRRFLCQYPFSKTNYLRVGPREQLIWGRNTWDIVDYYKRCCRNKLCRPIQYRGYTAWLKPAFAEDDPFFTTGPQGGLIIAGGGEAIDDGNGRYVPGEVQCHVSNPISGIPDKGKKKFRFLSCGPLKPGWGCSGKLSCHLDDGFCPKPPKPCECRGEFKGEVGCRECCGKDGSPSCCRKYCCGLDKFKPFGDPREQQNNCCPCPCENLDRYPMPPVINFGRKTLFRPLEKVPPMNLDLIDGFIKKIREKERIQKEKEEQENRRQEELELEEEEET